MKIGKEVNMKSYQTNFTVTLLSMNKTCVSSQKMAHRTKNEYKTYTTHNYYVAKSKEVKTGCNVVEFSKEGYGSKVAVLLAVVVWH
jgi:Na+-translocating ferredoxin:NAD+ oxidoreductase RnfG subunit